MIIDDSDYADTVLWVFVFASEVSNNNSVFILVCILINFTGTVTMIRKCYRLCTLCYKPEDPGSGSR
jgi:hypothetical protein